MTDWGRGGLTGSLNRWVKKEVQEQLSGNPLARRARYNWRLRVLRKFFSIGTFGWFLGLYLLVDLAAINVEGWWHILAPGKFPTPARDATAVALLNSVPSYLIGAQVGVLSVISLALALVTLIAQRDDASTDVQVYYHESLFFEITASSLALVTVLVVQLIWPLHAIYHLIGGGGHQNIFKFALLCVHLTWFIINIVAVSHFVSITFAFVQRQAREKLRENYTANVIFHSELTEKIREHLLSMAGTETIEVERDAVNPVCFGLRLPRP